MKKIIKGKSYDTATAKLMVSFWNGLSESDLRCMEEDLYLKKTGEFFLHGKGAPMTRWGRQVSYHTRSGGQDIVPLTQDEAKKWVEDNCNDEYENIFGKV